MPELGYGAHLLNRFAYFKEVSYQEIDSYCRLSGENIPGWEAQAMVTAMKAYQNMEHKARERACPSPLLSEEEAQMAIADSAFSAARAGSSTESMGKSV